jgi:hypothetical protein
MDHRIEFTPIPNAYPYALSSSGEVYNLNTKRRLKRQWVGNSWRTNIRRSDGSSFYFRHNDINSANRKESSSNVLERENIRPIPDWPRYAVTPYGTIWCVSTGARGRGSGAPFIVSEFYHRNRRHVTLSNKFGERRVRPVKKLVELAWGVDSEFREN